VQSGADGENSDEEAGEKQDGGPAQRQEGESAEDRLALAHGAGLASVKELKAAEEAERVRQDGEDLYDDQGGGE